MSTTDRTKAVYTTSTFLKFTNEKSNNNFNADCLCLNNPRKRAKCPLIINSGFSRKFNQTVIFVLTRKLLRFSTLDINHASLSLNKSILIEIRTMMN